MSKILFIDDEPDENIRAKRALERLNFEVNTCDSVLEAIQLLREGPDWSAAVVDMMMGIPEEWQPELKDTGVTGIKLLREAKAAIIAKKIPVLVFTNRRIDGIKDDLDALGIPAKLMDQVEKDILSPDEFAQRVWDLAGRTQD